MSTLIVLQQMIMIALLVAIGMFLTKQDYIDTAMSSKLSAIVLDVCCPAMILSSVLSGDISATHSQIIWSFIVCVVIYAFLIVLGLVLPKILFIPQEKRRFYNVMTIYGNIGFIGIPFTKAVLGEDAMLYCVVMNLLFMILVYTHGNRIILGRKGLTDLKSIVNVGTVSCVLALIIFWFNIKLPTVLTGTIDYVGQATTFLSMILLGVSLSRVSLLKILSQVRMYPYMIIRLIIIPLVVGFVLHALNMPDLMVTTCTLLTALPAANMPMIMAEKDGQDTYVISGGIAMSTILSLVTITIVMSVIAAI